jgi:hypothetical protein
VPTALAARAHLLHFVREWTPWDIPLDRLTDDQLACLVAELCREHALRLPGVARAVAALCEVEQ